MEVNKKSLYQLYVVEKKNAQEIANIYGYKSSTSIYQKMEKYGIVRRQGREAQKCYEPTKDELYYYYIEKQYSIDKIATLLDSSEWSISNKLKDYNISIKDKTRKCAGWNKGQNLPEEKREKLSKTRKRKFQNGELTHWNQGKHHSLKTRKKISQSLLKGHERFDNYYGKDWIIQRTSCLQRDNYMCQSCSSKEKLEVHHWEPYRFSYNNSLENLVTLCRECHNQIHNQYKQEGWIKEEECVFYA
jgi:hypothetical protein